MDAEDRARQRYWFAQTSFLARSYLSPFLTGTGKMQIAAAAAIATVLIAVFAAVASYVANYYTTSVGQWVANDLRMRTYHHLQQLSLEYYDSHQTGSLLSTITSDVQTIQGFASSDTLGILVDLLTIVGMLFIMFWLNWDFTLIAVAIARSCCCWFRDSKRR